MINNNRRIDNLKRTNSLKKGDEPILEVPSISLKPAVQEILNNILDEKLAEICVGITQAIEGKNKEYERQYAILEDKHNKLKQLQEKQFLRFTSIISEYQVLIFKMLSSGSLNLNTEIQEKILQVEDCLKGINEKTSLSTPRIVITKPKEPRKQEILE